MASNNMDKAQGTYDRFIGSLKWIVPLLVVITFLVIILIAD